MGKEFRGCSVSCRPMPEAASGEALNTEPKPHLVIDQDLDEMSSSAAEDEDAAEKGIAPKALTAELGQAIDAVPEVDWLHGNQDSHLRRDLDQRLLPRKAATISVASRPM